MDIKKRAVNLLFISITIMGFKFQGCREIIEGLSNINNTSHASENDFINKKSGTSTRHTKSYSNNKDENKNTKIDLTEIIQFTEIGTIGEDKKPLRDQIKDKLKEKLPELHTSQIRIDLIFHPFQATIYPTNKSRYTGKAYVLYKYSELAEEIDLSKKIDFKYIGFITESEIPLEDQIKDKLKKEFPELDISQIQVHTSGADSDPHSSFFQAKIYPAQESPYIQSAYVSYTYNKLAEEEEEEEEGEVSNQERNCFQQKFNYEFFKKPSSSHFKCRESRLKIDLKEKLKNYVNSPIRIIISQKESRVKQITNYLHKLLREEGLNTNKLHFEIPDLIIQGKKIKIKPKQIADNEYIGSAVIKYECKLLYPEDFREVCKLSRILNISKNDVLDKKKLNKLWRNKCLEWHEDKNRDKPENTQKEFQKKLKELNGIYSQFRIKDLFWNEKS